MMRQILERARGADAAAGCVVCHGGDPETDVKETAHGGAFYPGPGSPWINENTCGKCHPEQVSAQWNNLMMTQVGIIQGVAWGFGAMTGYNHEWGNYDAKDPVEKNGRLGSEAYRTYMDTLMTMEPQVFPSSIATVPAAPDSPPKGKP